MSRQLLFGPILCDQSSPYQSWRNNPQTSIGFAQMHESWKDAMKNEIAKTYFLEICNYVARERDQADYNKDIILPNQVLPAELKFISVYPKPDDVFAWTRYCRPQDVKVVIVGQDPYPNKNAEGLCFSANESKPSIENIFKALQYDDDVVFERPDIFNFKLEGWAEQGVLLLNTVLTVRGNIDREGKLIPNKGPKSHAGVGWEIFTDAVIQYINDNCDRVVFMLWGNDARNLKEIINQTKHLVLSAPHPASRGESKRKFLNCDHFSRANKFLEDGDVVKIKWSNVTVMNKSDVDV